MKIVKSEVIKPEDKVTHAIGKLSNDTKQALTELQEEVKKSGLDIEVFSQSLAEIIDNSITRLEAIDRTPDYDALVQPIADSFNALKKESERISTQLAALKLEPNIDVNVDAPDLTKLEEAFDALPSVLNEIYGGVDVIPSVEMRKIFKEIVELLTAIKNKQTTFIGGGGGGGGNSNIYGIDIATGNNVALFAVESVDFPGKYGLIVLNPDGTSIGTGGGTPAETFKRVTDTGDIRVTSGGDTRVYAA